MEHRKSNIELLRIISILFIIIFHCVFKSGFSFEPGISVNKLLVKTFYMFGELGVNLFILIFGYFMVNSGFKWKKLIRLLAEVQFYYWGTIFVACKLGFYELSGLKNIFLSFFPVTLNSYWFITAYIIVYILSTYFNILINVMDKKTYQKFLVTVLGLYCVLPTAFGLFLGSTETMLYYNRMIWMVVVYFLGAYIQKYGISIIRTKKSAVKVTVLSIVVLLSSILLINQFSDFFAALGINEPAFFWPPNTAPMISLSVGVFGLFLHLKTPYYLPINIVASTTLGIYLLHDGIMSSWIWNKVFKCTEYQNSPFLILHILKTAGVIFMVGVVIDLFRQRLERCTLGKIFQWCDSQRDMKVREIWTYCKKNISIEVLIFGVAFVIYVFLGLCISYKMIDTNIFFGADNRRAFEDLTCIKVNHYRTTVHPLFPLLTETITLFVNGMVNRSEMSVILIESFCGALVVSLFYSILKRTNTEYLIRVLFMLIYGFSFSMLIFSTVPESFIFSAVGLLGFWYFISLISGSNDKFTKKECFLLIFFGIVCFGTTLTNYIFYMVGLIYLLLCRYDIKKGVKFFFNINIINVVLVVILCKFQQFIWNDCPLFWTGIIDGICGRGYDEVMWMNWLITFPKTMAWVKQIAFTPLLSSDVGLQNPGEDYHPVLFYEYTSFMKLLLFVFYILLVGCIIYYLIKRLKRFNMAKDGYMIALLVAYVGNLVLHYIYGYNECFIYSPHYLFYFLLVSGISLENVGNRKIKKAIVLGLLFFVVIEVVNNLSCFFQTANLALSTMNSSIGLIHAAKGAVLCGSFLLVAFAGGIYRCRKGKVQLALSQNEKLQIQWFCKGIEIYGIVVFITGLFIAFNY